MASRDPAGKRKSPHKKRGSRQAGKKGDAADTLTVRGSIQGHRHVQALHRSTLEFTADPEVTPSGDCILGVRLRIDQHKLLSLHGKIRLMIGKEEVVGYRNPDFMPGHELVLRTSDFLSHRTYMIRANKAAKDLPRQLIGRLKDTEKRIAIGFSPVRIKAVLFDFDGTIEDWDRTEGPANAWVMETLMQLSGNKDYQRVSQAWREVEARHVASDRPDKFDRRLWFRDTLAALGVKLPAAKIEQLARKHWAIRKSASRLYPGARELLHRLRRRYRLGMVTDSDGERRFKLERLRHCRVDHLFETVVIGDDYRTSKPDPALFKVACRKLHVRPEEAMMVGDHPERDLLGAKPLGITTVWVRQGEFANLLSRAPPYIDYTVTDISEVLTVAKDLEQ